MSTLKEKFNLSELTKNEIYVGEISQREKGLAIMLFSTFDKPYEANPAKATRFGKNGLIAALGNTEAIVNVKTAWINPRGASAELFATLQEGDNFNDFLVANNLPEQAIVVWEVTESEFATLSEAEQKLFGRTKDGELAEKINPSTGDVLMKEGEKIYTASVLCELENLVDDVFVAHDKVAVAAPAAVPTRAARAVRARA